MQRIGKTRIVHLVLWINVEKTRHYLFFHFLFFFEEQTNKWYMDSKCSETDCRLAGSEVTWPLVVVEGRRKNGSYKLDRMDGCHTEESNLNLGRRPSRGPQSMLETLDLYVEPPRAPPPASPSSLRESKREVSWELTYCQSHCRPAHPLCSCRRGIFA